MNTSLQGYELIRQYEGFSPRLYMCPAGKPTIGYGHVVASELVALVRSSPPISEEKGEQLLKSDAQEVENALNASVSVMLTQGQFDALVSLVYNWGIFNFKASQGLQELNNGDYNAAANEFFSKENGVVDINHSFSGGLYKRRQAELVLWQS